MHAVIRAAAGKDYDMDKFRFLEKAEYIAVKRQKQSARDKYWQDQDDHYWEDDLFIRENSKRIPVTSIEMLEKAEAYRAQRARKDPGLHRTPGHRHGGFVSLLHYRPDYCSYR